MAHRRDLLLVFMLSVAIGGCWAGITPAFEKTDETAHFAYVQAFAELGHPPRQFVDTGLLSPELACWYNGLGIIHYRFFVEERPPWSAGVRHSLDHGCASLSPRYEGTMYMAFQPPAYYALAGGAYKLASGFALPTRLLFARLISVLLTAMAVAFTYLLVCEVIPGSRWPARAAALSLALQPVFMFNESGVNPDALLVAVASAIAFLGASAWRRGLTTRRAVVLGALTGLGVLSKTNFLALLPSVLLLAGALWWGCGEPGERGLRAKRLVAGGAVAGAIFGLYALVNSVAWHRGLTYRDASYGGPGGSLHRLLEFTWQFFLPRFSGMHNLVGSPGIPFIELIENSTTRLGWWNDYGLANGWTPVLMTMGGVLAVAGAWYVIPRARRRPAPALVALGCGILFLAALVWAGYEFSLGNGVDVIIPRHALPLMSLWGLVVGCAIAAVRPRWRPTATGIVTALFLAHTLIALTTTTSRFYL
jgi:4-amino-4-deoxy-L-arabinose transferase-like glycosyltransferase